MVVVIKGDNNCLHNHQLTPLYHVTYYKSIPLQKDSVSIQYICISRKIQTKNAAIPQATDHKIKHVFSKWQMFFIDM